MDLKSGYPWWAVRNGLPHAFPRLEQDLRCDVAVIGGGITAALVAEELARNGHDTVVLEQRDIAWGSTSASTALLQYEIDTPMTELARRYGEQDAALAYLSCADAVKWLAQRAGRLRDVGFQRSDSLYFASRRRHRHDLRTEFELRARHGLQVEWLDADAISTRFGFTAPAAILSAQAAAVDPYRMTYRIMTALERGGTPVFDRTCVGEIVPRSRDVVLRTREGLQVVARHVVVAAGYASQQWLRPKVARNRSSYAVISDPLDPGPLDAFARTLAWETARPYLYFRITPDRRLLVGGEDDAMDVPARRDRRVPGKSRRLLRRIAKMFPESSVVPAFSWGGTFAETEDGLPFFDAHASQGSRVLFAMAYGGNGITYSVLGASLLRARIERRPHPLARLFSFERIGA